MSISVKVRTKKKDLDYNRVIYIHLLMELISW